jgi:predicted ATPase/class 3 adenylate cyclase
MHDAARTRPTGTVAFLFTDIEGSTERWERYGAAMADAVRRHDALVRAALEAHDGYVFKALGDAFCAAFATARDAVAAAAAAQRALAREDWSAVDRLAVRIAIHAGTADERDGDYFGPTLNRVARLLGTASGGQTILSAAAAALAGDELPAGASLRDLGTHRLKDLAAPEDVRQLVLEDLPNDFPPLRALDARARNLPIALTPLLGRDETIAEIAALVDADRLVTLVGAGGVGKTRAALAVAARYADAHDDGVWFVEFAPIDAGSLVSNAIALALGVRERAGRDPLDALIAHVGAHPMLLVLDNCEHVIDDAARVAEALLRACPRVRLLCTSRERLAVGGERVYRMPSLAVPPPDVDLTAADAERYAAVALFVARASAIDARFRLTDDNARIVGDICRRLDGIALAIELAAARVKILPVARLAERLDERFRLLTTGPRAVLPRQQTLLALIDWSYALLTDTERAVFRRVAIFADAWTFEDAVAVCADDALDEFALLDALVALVEKSLVAAEPDAGTQRHHLLDSMRAFGRLRLTETGETATWERRRAVWALARVEAWRDAWAQRPSADWQRAILPLVPDARAALHWCFAPGGDVGLGIRLTSALGLFYTNISPAEGAIAVDAALAHVEARKNVEAGAIVDDQTIAFLHFFRAELAKDRLAWSEVVDDAQRAEDILARLDDRERAAVAQRVRGQGLHCLGRSNEARALIERAIATFRAHDADRHLAMALSARAVIDTALGAFADARAAFAEAIPLAARSGYDHALFAMESNLAELEFAEGDAARAIELARSAVGRTSLVGDALLRAVAFANLAMYEASVANWPAARAAANDALAIAGDRREHWVVYSALQTLAEVTATETRSATTEEDGDPVAARVERAARVLGYVDARLSALGAPREPTEQRGYDRLRTTLENNAPEAAIARWLAAGASLTFENALALTTSPDAMPRRRSPAAPSRTA